MKNYFYKLSDHAVSLADNSEFLMLNLSGEESDFIRLNHAEIRQNGNVKQYYLSMTLIKNGRQASNFMTLTLDEQTDRSAVTSGLKKLRTVIGQLDEDPYILYSTEVRSTEVIEKDLLPDTFEAVSQIMGTAKGLDLTGIFSSGNIVAGFANSIGQRNWFEKPSFNFNWSVYHTTDKAVKAGYAGYVWNSTDFERKMKKVKNELEIMKRDAVTIKPGKYKVFIAPAALDDFMAILGWGGFGLKSQRTKNSSLLKLIDGEVKLDSSVSIIENSLEGSSPNFNSTGFIKQDKVELIKNGLHAGSLISPRSSKEFNVPTNGAGGYEE
ncbi:MAG TPA: metallopeptidase TldD-related protein, partial [bacterium]|nr:metallopeptidase TldD-related protein [bacterium]